MSEQPAINVFTGHPLPVDASAPDYVAPLDTPWRAFVPRTLTRNLRWRMKRAIECEKSIEARICLRQACEDDLIFFVNGFLWTLDPRKLTSNSEFAGACTPFVAWDYQEESLLSVNNAIETGKDLMIEKSRDMGASWLVCAVFLWRFLFVDHQSFLMVSRKESLVDGDDDSLFSHMDFMLKRLPLWMRPDKSIERTKLYLKNHQNESVIEGESTTDNIGRGGRRTSILLDEFAAFDGGGYQALSATADNTNCRIMNSTPKGTANAFYAQREKGTRRIRMHWSRHPEKRRGLYRVLGGGQFEKLDARFDYSSTNFIDEVPRSEEGVRSPWYDKECLRRAHAWEIAQELDIDYQGSNFPFFDPRVLEQLRIEFCKAPKRVGKINKIPLGGDEYRYEWEDDHRGHVKLWCDLEVERQTGRLRPPHGRDYIMGADISHGTGASDSAAVVVDMLSGVKVAEMAHNTWGINEFARLCDDLGRFFASTSSAAYFIWEATGPGRTFGQVMVIELQYPNYYFNKDVEKIGAVQTAKYGWYSSLDGKTMLLTNYRMLLADRVFINPSAESIREAGFYVFESGRVVWAGPGAVGDPSNKGANHGDRVTADALCAKILFERKQGGRKDAATFEPNRDPPVLSKAWRMKHWTEKPTDDMVIVSDMEN